MEVIGARFGWCRESICGRGRPGDDLSFEDRLGRRGVCVDCEIVWDAAVHVVELDGYLGSRGDRDLRHVVLDVLRTQHDCDRFPGGVRRGVGHVCRHVSCHRSGVADGEVDLGCHWWVQWGVVVVGEFNGDEVFAGLDVGEVLCEVLGVEPHGCAVHWVGWLSLGVV